MSIRKNQLDKALQHLEKAVEAYPEYSEAYKDMGVIHLKMGKRAEAEKTFSRAVEADPSFFRAGYRLGYADLARKEYSLALEAFQQFLRTNQGMDASGVLGVVQQPEAALSEARQNCSGQAAFKKLKQMKKEK